MTRCLRATAGVSCAAVLCAAAPWAIAMPAAAADARWPSFRGPSAGVAADNPRLPETWSATENIAWKTDVPGLGWSSPIVWDDLIYNLYSQGFLTAHDARTGEQVYGRKRVDAGASGFTASPWAYNGKVFVASEDGDTYVIQAGPEYKLIAKNSLGEMLISTPAIVRDSLIMRTVGRIYRIGKK